MDLTLKIAIISAIAVIIAALIKLLGDLIGKGSPNGLVFTIILVILALIGGGVFILFIQTPPTPAESTNWAFTLEYRFPARFWSVRSHSYSLAWTCPNEAPDSVSREFTVSENFPPVSGDVYLRWSSLRAGNPWGELVEGINPSQSTIASVAWDMITKSEAERRALNCTGTVSWDGGAAEPLSAQIPFQR